MNIVMGSFFCLNKMSDLEIWRFGVKGSPFRGAVSH